VTGWPREVSKGDGLNPTIDNSPRGIRRDRRSLAVGGPPSHAVPQAGCPSGRMLSSSGVKQSDTFSAESLPSIASIAALVVPTHKVVQPHNMTERHRPPNQVDVSSTCQLSCRAPRFCTSNRRCAYRIQGMDDCTAWNIASINKPHTQTAWRLAIPA